MGIREAATHPSQRPEETIWCTGDVLAVQLVLAWQLRASKCGYLLREPIFSSKRYAGDRREERRQSRQDAGLPTHWALSLLVWLIVVIRICFVFAPLPFISSLEFHWFDVDFRQPRDVLDAENTKNRAAIHTHNPLYTHTTIGGIAVGEMRAEGIVAMEAQKWGRAHDVLVFGASRPSTW